MLTAKLEAEFKKRGMEYAAGKVLTTDAFFRETMAKLERVRAQSAVAVEMELSAMFTLARFRKIDFASAVVISDEHADGEWKSGFTSPSLFLNLLKVVDCSLDALTQ
jgi:purine-nucleoside phosphorylase